MRGSRLATWPWNWARPLTPSASSSLSIPPRPARSAVVREVSQDPARGRPRSEEHTSELQSHLNLVCRLLLEKKKKHPSCTCVTPAPHVHEPRTIRAPLRSANSLRPWLDSSV